MWTYRDEIQPIPSAPDSTSFQTAHYAHTPVRKLPAAPAKTFRAHVHSRQSQKPHALLKIIVLLYIFGIGLGVAISTLCNSTLLNYMKYYISTATSRFIQKQYGIIFGTGFLSIFLQLTVLLLAGLCAFGVVIIPMVSLLKGVGTGCFFSLIYVQFGLAKGLFLELLFFLIPELISLFLIFSISLSSWHVSKNLLNSCLRMPSGKLSENLKKMLYRYMILCLVAIIPCVFSVLMSAVFSPLFL